MTTGRFAPGARLGPYEIRAPLGAGGMGEVYRAYDARLDRALALKVLPERAFTDDDVVDRFVREARAASALNHPNVVTIYDVGLDAGARYIAMELVEGASLREHMQTPPPLEIVARLGAQIARALAVAHRAGIVHRDIKPENLMWREDGLVKVLDFGIARLAGPTADATATRSGMVIGTLRYMSPEQACAEPVHSQSDVFSLGVVLYELLTGQHPFKADSGNTALLTALLTVTPPTPSVLTASQDPRLDALLLAMLSKEPSERPDAASLASALDAIALGARGQPDDVVPTPRTEHATAPLVAVGREEEQSLLRERLAAATVGHGSLVTIAGEPGLGKTVLIEAFLHDARTSDSTLRVLRGRCSERLAGAEAFLPVLEALEQLLTTGGAELAALMRRVAPTWYLQVASVDADAPNDLQRLASDRASSPERLKREFVNLLDAVGRTGPLVIFLDDVHWADGATVDLLSYVGPRLPELPLLLLATVRPSDLQIARHPFGMVKLDLQARGIAFERVLSFLAPGDVRHLVERAFPGHAFPDGLLTLLHERTEGSPLFVADALRWLRTSGLVAERDGVWQLTASLSSVQVDIPASIRSMIQRKFEQLTDGDRRLLAAASIQGTDFDSAVVSIVAGLAADEVEERLDALEHVYGLVRHVAVHDLPDGTLNVRYRFVHAMYQNALYASLTPTRKVALSARAAQALATHHDALSADIALPLALLYEAAREPARAVDQFLVAARRAARLFAMEESLALADRALALTMSLSLSADRDRRTMRAEELRAAALSALRGLGDVEVVAAGQRALALWQALDRPLADASIPMAIVGSLIVTGQFTVAAAMADEMVAYAEAANDRVLFAAAACNGGIARVHRGDWRDAERLLSRGLTAYDPAHPEAYVDFLLEPGVYMYAERARARWVLGHPDAARADARAAMDLAERVPHREARAFAPLFAAYVEEFCGNALGVRAHAERILTLARERDITTILPWALMLDGWSSAVLDGHDDGLARLRESLALQLSIGLLVDRPRFLGLEVDVLLRRHRFDEACAQADQALAVANRTGNHCWDSDLHRQRAIALHGVGAPADDIDATLALARTVADEQGAVSLRLRAAVTGRELWMQRAEPRRGVDDLTAALAVVTEGADTADLQRARALRAAAAP